MSASELMSDGRSSASLMSESVKNIVASVRPGAIDNSLLVTSHSRVLYQINFSSTASSVTLHGTEWLILC